MLNIKMSKETLFHTYQKHNLKRSDIEKALGTGIRSIFNGVQGRQVVYTMDYTAIVIDKDSNLISAYRSDQRQYRIKAQKSKINGKKIDPSKFELVK